MSSYKIWVKDKVLGSGGFGVVTLWRHSESGQKIALKKCRWGGAMGNGGEHLLTPKHIERWEKEVEIMKKLDHPAVVKSFTVPQELVESDIELPMLCMEYCSNGDLRKVLNRSENCCGLTELEIRSCLRDSTDAVAYLHSLRIIHRDLKPENIVLQNVDGQIRYKLIDLGYAKELEQGSVCTSFVGTLQYLAPELFLSKRYSCTVDYWSMGLLAHEIVTGFRPFLPHMTPVEWMKRVKNKKWEHICVYENLDGTIELSSKIFPETQISLPFRKHLEDWLRIMLEWDPSRRGHVVNESGTQDLVAFSKMLDILSRKVIKAFVVETCELHEYEVSEETTMDDVKSWIQNDTNIAMSDQRLLLPRGQAPDSSRSAMQCWAPPDEEEWMLYVFSDSMARAHVPPHFPSSVEEMLRNSKVSYGYRNQRRMWAHSIFFLRKEVKLLTYLSQAQKVAMLHLLSFHSQLTKTGQKMLSSAAKLQARHDLFIESLNSDLNMYEEQASHGVSSQKLYRSWREMGELTLVQFQTVMERVQQIESSLNAVSSKMLEIQCPPFGREVSADTMHSIITASEELYSALKRKPKEERSRESENTDMCKLMVQALRKRDRLHKDIYKHLEKQCGCLSEVVGLSTPLESVLQDIARLAQSISSHQMKRQKDIWKVMEIAVSHGENRSDSQGALRPRSVSPRPPASSDELKQTLDSPLLKEIDSMIENSAKETRSLINQNRILRSQMMELLTVMIPTTLNVGATTQPS